MTSRISRLDQNIVGSNLLFVFFIAGAFASDVVIEDREVQKVIDASPCASLEPSNTSLRETLAKARVLWSEIKNKNTSAKKLGLRPPPKRKTPAQKLFIDQVRETEKKSEQLGLDLAREFGHLEKLVAKKTAEIDSSPELACAEHLMEIQILLKAMSKRILNPKWQIAVDIQPAKIPLEKPGQR